MISTSQKKSIQQLFHQLLISTILTLFAVFFVTGTAIAGSNEGETGGQHFVPKPPKAPTAPSSRYSGSTPIDESNGIVMNSGTYGLRNAEYEAWASSPTIAVSISDRAYSYEQKKRFISTLDERIRHFELAVWNYSRVNESVSKAEGKAHADKTAADLAPRIEKAREAWSKAKSAGASEWENAQSEAKRMFLDLQAFYYGTHKNVN